MARDHAREPHEAAVAGELKRDTVSGPDGEFAFDGLYPGEARVRARAPGFLKQGQPDFELIAGKETRQDLVLRRPRRLTGCVRDSAGDPIPNAAVLVREWSVQTEDELEVAGRDNNRFVVFRADAEGRYDTGTVLEKIPWGGSEVLAWADGFGMSIKPVAEAPEPHGLEAVLDFGLGPERPLVLQVRDPLGRPISGADVGAGEASSTHGWVPYPLCSTDALGIARVEHIPREKQKLSVRKEGYHPAGIEAAPDGPEEMELVLEPLGAVLEARIVYDERIPEVARKHVEVWLVARDALGKQRLWEQSRAWSGLVHAFRPRESGRYSFAYRPAGEIVETEPFDHDANKPLVVEIPIRLAPPYVKGVVVRSRTGEPVRGAEVIARRRREGEVLKGWADGTNLNSFPFPGVPDVLSRASTDEKGRFLVLLPALEEKLQVTLTAGGPLHGWSADVSLDVDRGEEVRSVTLDLEPSGRIEGKLRSITGAPVHGRIIAAYDGARSLKWRITDSSGRYILDGLRPCRHALEVLGPGPISVGHGGGGTCPGDTPPPHEVFDLRVEVRAGETTVRDLALEEDALGVVEGRVSEGLPREAQVRIVLKIDGVPCSGMAFEHTTRVMDGRFRIENLHAGTYGVYLMAPGAPLARAEVRVQRGSTVEAVVEDPTGTVVIPIQGGAGLLDLETALTWRESSLVPEEPGLRWTPWKFAALEITDSEILLRGVPEGLVRIGLRARGIEDTWTDELGVSAGSVTRSRPLEIGVSSETE